MIASVARVLGNLRAPRMLAFLVCDAAVLSVALLLAFMLRFEGIMPAEYRGRLPALVGVSILTNLPVFYAFGLYRMSWRYTSFYELINVFEGVTIGALLFGSIMLIALRDSALAVGLPRTVFVLNFLLTLLLLGALRSGKRISLAMFERKQGLAKRLLIVGAGSAGELLLRDIRRNPALGYEVVGLVDDDPKKHGLTLHGVPVVGSHRDVPDLVRSEGIEEIIIAIPSASPRTLAEIASVCKKATSSVKILPAIYGSLLGQIKVGYLREIRIEDLLTRRPVRIDVESVAAAIRGECVLVTGAGGSIGSELCRQVAALDPGALVLLGHAENDIFEIESELAQLNLRAEVVPIIGDVRSAEKIDHVFRTFRPSLVFHAAAHKHVALMEGNPDEAVYNNILGTKLVAEASDRYGVGRMVFVSTDKAVNPTGVMGASKRFAELVIQSMVHRSLTKFMIVRFGNVLNSTGSVVPIFLKQIARGGPVTITDPAMRRFFMTIPEAVHLIIQASALGRGGEVFVLDMGEPVRIIDLAENLVRLSGLEPNRDIAIEVIGPRVGEKMHEEAFCADETVERTAHEHIFVAKVGDVPEPSEINMRLDALIQVAARRDRPAVRLALLEAVGANTRRPAAEVGPERSLRVLGG